MATPEYDALVVGARVAGATVAARLADQGRKVLLVDRDEFPSDTISTHALGFNAVESLRRLGVLDRIEAAGFRRIFRHRAWVEDICIEAPAGPPGMYSLAPRRIVLDQILLALDHLGRVELVGERVAVVGVQAVRGDVLGDRDQAPHFSNEPSSAARSGSERASTASWWSPAWWSAPLSSA